MRSSIEISVGDSMNSIVLTGINRGLGKELCNLLLNSDLDVTKYIFVSRRSNRVNQRNVQYIDAQLELHDQVSRLRHEMELAPANKLIIFVSNAGAVDPIKKATEVDVVEMENSLRVNCLSALGIAQELTKRAKKIGARLFIINVSSGAAQHPIKGWIAYCVSKAATVMAFDVLAEENENVEVIHFDPGVMDTDMQKHIRGQSSDVMPDVEVFKKYKTTQCLRSPMDVANSIVSIIQCKLNQ